MSDDYERIEREVNVVRNLGTRWDRYVEIPDPAPDRIVEWAASRRLPLDAVRELWRMRYEGQGRELVLGWPVENRRGVVTAIKKRNLGTGAKTSERGSAVVVPRVLGALNSEDWIVAEGETEAARLYSLVGDVCAVLCLPWGAHAIDRGTLAPIPSGAVIYTALDADSAGDIGSHKIANLWPGETVRMRPPGGIKDWCEWDGTREDFLRAMQEERKYAELGGRPRPVGELMKAYRERPAVDGVWDPFELVEVKPGFFVSLAGYFGDGKSIYALQWALEAASRGHRVVYFNLEMPEYSLLDRVALVADAEGYDDEVLDNVLLLSVGYIEDFSGYLSDFRPDIAFVDHLHRLGTAKERKEFEATVRKLRSAALAHEVGVVAVCQLTEDRGGNSRSMYPRPAEGRIRDTAVIAQEADETMFVWRERTMNDERRPDGEIYTLKGRHNPGSGDVRFVRMHSSIPLFVERDEHDEIFDPSEPRHQPDEWKETEDALGF